MKIIGLDCEMITVYPDKKNSLARVSIVNEKSVILYDEYVKQRQRVQCYRTNITGIRKVDLRNGKTFQNARRDVMNIIKDSILVGHGIDHDLKVLNITPKDLLDINCEVRDTAMYGYFRQVSPNGTPSLKLLASKFLNKNIQVTTHNSVEDAQAVVLLYMKVKDMWESEIQWHERWNRCNEESEESDENEESSEESDY